MLSLQFGPMGDVLFPSPKYSRAYLYATGHLSHLEKISYPSYHTFQQIWDGVLRGPGNLGVCVAGSRVRPENLCIRAKEEQTDGKEIEAALVEGEGAVGRMER